MSAIVILLIRHTVDTHADPSVLVRAASSYLATFGSTVSVISVRYLTQVRGGSGHERAALCELGIAGDARVKLSTRLERLEKALRQTAKDAELDVRLEVFEVVEPVPPSKEGRPLL